MRELLLIIGLLISNCLPGQVSNDTQLYKQALIDEFGQTGHIWHFVIGQTTTDDFIFNEIIKQNFSEFTEKGLDSLDSLTYKIFKTIIKTVEKFDTISTNTLLVQLEYTDSNTMRHIYSSENGWAEFYKHYPMADGYLKFSKIGYNPEHNRALIYIGYSGGMTSGYGFVVLYRLRSGQWIKLQKKDVWIS
jgi:hypothetical protein